MSRSSGEGRGKSHVNDGSANLSTRVLVWATRSRTPHACASVNTATCAQHVRVHRGRGVSGTLRAGCAPQGGQACEGLRAHVPATRGPPRHDRSHPQEPGEGSGRPSSAGEGRVHQLETSLCSFV